VLAIPGLLYTKTIIVIIITQKRKEKERKRDPILCTSKPTNR